MCRKAFPPDLTGIEGWQRLGAAEDGALFAPAAAARAVTRGRVGNLKGPGGFGERARAGFWPARSAEDGRPHVAAGHTLQPRQWLPGIYT